MATLGFHEAFKQDIQVTVPQFSDPPDISILGHQLLLDSGLHPGCDLCQREPCAIHELLLGAGLKQAKTIHEIFKGQLIGLNLPALIEVGASRIQITLGMLDLDRSVDSSGVRIGQLAVGSAADP